MAVLATTGRSSRQMWEILVKRLFGSRTDQVKSPRAAAAGTLNAAEPPSHLRDYLDYYRSLKEPHYAVLVTGDWGTGKTYQVREAIPKDEAYYVSLFGLNSADDVIAEIYTAMFPGKARLKKIASKVGETTAEIPGVGSLAISGLTSGLVGAFLRQKVSNDKPIIFDDLERCGLSVKETLGIINLYVEHHGCRVIVIAHDQKMMEGFSEAKEKIFGQTIRVEPQVGAAFDAFYSALSEGSEKGLIAKQRDSVLRLFLESQAQSLRILRHVIEDLARLTRALSDRHRAHDQAMVELVLLFSALDIEWRANRLVAADLSNRAARAFSYKINRSDKEANGEVPGIVSAGRLYSSVDLTSQLLNDTVLSQMLVEGRFDTGGIQASLDASSYFLKARSAPPWQIVSNFDKLDDDTVSAGTARMQEQFDQREVCDPGEILHIFALRLMMASKGILLGKDIDTAVKECKVYVDEILLKGKLPSRSLDWDWNKSFETGAYGFTYWVADDYKDHFQDLYRYLLDACNRALEAKFPQLSSDLLKVVEIDGRQFFEQVCYTHAGNNQYASVPILAAIDPKDFVAAWMRAPRSSWYWISSALQERYKGSSRGKDLKPEAEWIDAVVKLLGEQADKASGLAKVRIQRTIPKLAPIPAEASLEESY